MGGTTEGAAGPGAYWEDHSGKTTVFGVSGTEIKCGE